MNEQELIEQLAHFEHASWANWMSYLFSQCNKDLDWNMTISGSLVKRWMRQIETPYAELSEREKQSDRDEVAHILPIIKSFAKKNDNTITIDRDYFEHLLNCLANQKFLYIPDSKMSDREKAMQSKIDDAHTKGRELLSNSLQGDMREERGSE